MDKLVELSFKTFESFIKRALVPSSSFLFIAATLYLLSGKNYNQQYIEWLKTQFVFDWYMYAMFFVGLSYFLSILQQATIDNLLKGNFSSGENLKVLRNTAIEKLKQNNEWLSKQNNDTFNDYMLYQILGKNIETKQYADDSKAIGIFTVSLILNLMITGYFANICCCYIPIPIVFYIGYYLTKQRYKARAFRIYITYLAKTPKK